MIQRIGGKRIHLYKFLMHLYRVIYFIGKLGTFALLLLLFSSSLLLKRMNGTTTATASRILYRLIITSHSLYSSVVYLQNSLLFLLK